MEKADSLETGLARYFSQNALKALQAAHVGIIGAGGLGSNVAVMLARSGIRCMTIVDHDKVDASNLNRQAYVPADIGLPKVQALARHLTELEPAMALTTHVLRATPGNVVSLFATCPILVEAVDLAETKAMLYALFAPQKACYVTASGMAGFGCDRAMLCRKPRPSVTVIGDCAQAVDEAHPPLAPRVMQAAAMQADAVLSYILTH